VPRVAVRFDEDILNGFDDCDKFWDIWRCIEAMDDLRELSNRFSSSRSSIDGC
jgi:hypothetical protein